MRKRNAILANIRNIRQQNDKSISTYHSQNDSFQLGYD